MPLTERSLTDDDIRQLKDLFKESLDLTLVRGVIYFDGWSDFEECGGIFIFRGIDDSIQKAEYGESVLSSEPTVFRPVELTEAEATEEIRQMQEHLASHQGPEM